VTTVLHKDFQKQFFLPPHPASPKERFIGVFENPCGKFFIGSNFFNSNHRGAFQIVARVKKFVKNSIVLLHWRR